MAFVIPSGIYDLYNRGIDATILSNSLPLLLILPPTQSPCDNCITNVFNGISSNIYNGSGILAFTFGKCPRCGGTGYLITENTITFNACVYWNINPKNFYNVVDTKIQLNIPGDFIQTKSFFTDYANIKRAQKLRVSQLTANNVSMEYQMYGEPLPVGFNNRYLLCNWKRM